MPSARRIRLLTLVIVVTVVFVLYYSSGGSSSDGSFYDKTMQAIHHPHGQNVINSRTGEKTGHIPADRDGDGDIDEDDKRAKQQLVESLGEAAQEAQDKANKKAPVKPDNPSKVVGIGSSREGQDKKKAGVAPVPKVDDNKAELADSDDTKQEKMAEVEFNSILKQAPVIIFSKSYCPYSKRAKGILLDKYSIEPKPHVVELDVHPLGSALQDILLEKTGRRTVPNILINGVSMGGSDQIVDLDEHDELTAKMQQLGNRKVQVSRLLVAEEVKGASPQ